MGNQLSNETGSGRPLASFGKRGALGLSKQELDRRCQPSGLYPTCAWDEKAIRRLIGDGRLAARLKGKDSRQHGNEQECPICFLQYSQINVTQCCRANICTECFLQVRPQKADAHSTGKCVCPFCNHSRFYVTIAKRLDPQQVQQRQEEEDRVYASQLKAREEQEFKRHQQRQMANEAATTASLQPDPEQALTPPAAAAAAATPPQDFEEQVQMLRSVSLTKADRQNIEQEMRAQHTHPLVLQMEMEAEERRIANDREYFRTHSGRRLFQQRQQRNMRASWSHGPRRNSATLDDMVVMETAIILSMEEEEQRRRRQQQSGNSSGSDINHNSVTSNGTSGASGSTHGFDTIPTPDLALLLAGDNALTPTNQAPSRAALETTTMLLGGVTEDEQMAMAIALSMQDSGKINTGKDEIAPPAAAAAKRTNEEEDDDEKEENEDEEEEDDDAGEEKKTDEVDVADLKPEALPKKGNLKVPPPDNDDGDDDDKIIENMATTGPIIAQGIGVAIGCNESLSSFAVHTTEDSKAPPAAAAVACAPKMGDDDYDDDEEEETNLDVTTFKTGKFSDDDSVYFRQQAGLPNLKEQVLDMDIPVAMVQLQHVVEAGDNKNDEENEADEEVAQEL